MSEKGLRPYRADVYLYYKCSYCQSEHVQTLKEVKKIGKILCVCGQILILEKIHKIIVEPQYAKNTKNFSPPIIKSKVAENDFAFVVQGLKKLGLSTKQAKNCLDKVSTNGIIYSKVDDLFHACIKEITHV